MSIKGRKVIYRVDGELGSTSLDKAFESSCSVVGSLQR